MNTAPCNCGTQTSRPSVNERPRYYARQLITPDDLTLEQDYFRTKLRRHNRFLHGWGVVCGADVVPSEQPGKVVVKTGYILGPYGDEIYIEKDQCVDVSKLCAAAQPPPSDYECTEYQAPPPPGGPLYIAVRYVENKTRLIRVPLGGCGCEDNACEYSRFSDGYEICVLDHCPDSHSEQEEGLIEIGRTVECPECPAEPWVVLSQFTVDGDGAVTVQPTECRRQLISFGALWKQGRKLVSKEMQPPAEVVEAKPPTAAGTAPAAAAPDGS